MRRIMRQRSRKEFSSLALTAVLCVGLISGSSAAARADSWSQRRPNMTGPMSHYRGPQSGGGTVHLQTQGRYQPQPQPQPQPQHQWSRFGQNVGQVQGNRTQWSPSNHTQQPQPQPQPQPQQQHRFTTIRPFVPKPGEASWMRTNQTQRPYVQPQDRRAGGGIGTTPTPPPHWANASIAGIRGSHPLNQTAGGYAPRQPQLQPQPQPQQPTTPKSAIRFYPPPPSERPKASSAANATYPVRPHQSSGPQPHLYPQLPTVATTRPPQASGIFGDGRASSAGAPLTPLQPIGGDNGRAAWGAGGQAAFSYPPGTYPQHPVAGVAPRGGGGGSSNPYANLFV